MMCQIIWILMKFNPSVTLLLIFNDYRQFRTVKPAHMTVEVILNSSLFTLLANFLFKSSSIAFFNIYLNLYGGVRIRSDISVKTNIFVFTKLLFWRSLSCSSPDKRVATKTVGGAPFVRWFGGGLTIPECKADGKGNPNEQLSFKPLFCSLGILVETN